MSARHLTTLLLLALLLAACGAAVQTPTPPAGQVRAPVTITFWHPWNGLSARVLADLTLQYQVQHPGVTILLQEHAAAFLRDDYRRAVLSGGPPDLVLLQSNRWLGEFADAKLLLPLDSLMDAQTGVRLAQSFYPQALEGSRYGAQLYGLPIAADLPVLFYNRANFPSGPPSDTQKWLELARIQRGQTPPQWGLAWNLTLDFTLPYLPAFGGAILDEQGRLVLGSSGAQGAQDWLTWLREVRRLSQAGDLLAAEDHQAIDQAVQSGQAQLMVVDWSSRLPRYRSLWRADVGIAALPPLLRPGYENPNPAIPAVHTEILAINPRSGAEQQRVAFDFMQWLTSPAAQRRLFDETLACATCALKGPVRLDLELQDAPLASQLLELAQAGQPASPLPAMQASWSYIEDMVRTVLSDRLRAEEAVPQTAAQLCALLQQPDC